MKQTYSKVVAALTLALLCSASAAVADVLWDQSTIDLYGPGIVASNSPGFGGFVAHTVDDVTVPAAGWHVTQITQYYGGFNYAWLNLTQGYVNVKSKTGALPSGSPSAVQVPMSCSIIGDIEGNQIWAVTAVVSLDLAAGDYWIGLTPTAPAGLDGANLMWPSVTQGSPVATYMAPGPWDAFYGDYDGAFKVEGYLNQPVPTARTTWGSVKALYR